MDIKHRQLMNILVKKFKNHKIEPEVYYNHFGLKGYIDLVLETQHNGYIIEIKTECHDLGEIIRQLNTPIKALDKYKNYTKVLAVPFINNNRIFIKENMNILFCANITVLCIINVDAEVVGDEDQLLWLSKERGEKEMLRILDTLPKDFIY